jgi:long-subunit acyl-CoA synthetase (AMP-forming)
MKGLLVFIYSTPITENCGSDRTNIKGYTLTGEGVAEIFTPSEDYPEAVLVKRNLFGRVVFHAVPKDLQDAGKWSMNGGAFVSTSDSRFTEAVGGMYGAIPLHDRTENY